MIKKILNTLFTKVFSAGASFAILIIVSHVLGTEGKGEQAIIAFNIYIITLILTLIGNSTLIYLTPRKSFNNLFLPSLLYMLVISVLAIVLLTLIPALSNEFMLQTVLISLLASLSEVNYFVLMGKEKVLQANGLKMILPIVNIVIISMMLIFNKFDSINDYVFSLWVAYGLSLIYGIYLLRNEYFNLKIPSKNEFIESTKILFKLGALKQAGSIAQTLNYRLSFYILAYFCGKGLVGIYSNACSLSEAVMMFGTSLALVQYSSLSNKQSNKQAKTLTLQLTKVNALVTVLAMSVLCLLPKEVWIWIFGEGFGDISRVIKLLALGVALLSCSSNFTQYFASRGNFSISAFAAIAGLVVTLALSLTFIPLWGLDGAAIAATCSYITTFSIECIFFIKWIKK